MTICDLPHDVRFRRRLEANGAGCEVIGYHGACMTLAFPRDWPPAVAKLARAGWRKVGDPWLMPLGTDNPPEHMRHDGSYPESRGFHMYLNAAPPECKAPAD